MKQMIHIFRRSGKGEGERGKDKGRPPACRLIPSKESDTQANGVGRERYQEVQSLINGLRGELRYAHMKGTGAHRLKEPGERSGKKEKNGRLIVQ